MFLLSGVFQTDSLTGQGIDLTDVAGDLISQCIVTMGREAAFDPSPSRKKLFTEFVVNDAVLHKRSLENWVSPMLVWMWRG